jgi:hypothetical protein
VFDSGSRWPALVALLIVPAAVLGFVLGHHGHTIAAAPPRTHAVYAADAVLEAPASWTTTAPAPAIPGLTLQSPTTLAPRGAPASGGILVGQLGSEGITPLPATLLAHVAPAPHGEVVSLAETQAYRYANLRPAGFAGALELYAIPRTGGGTTGVACYAQQAGSEAMRACEQIVAAMRLVGQPRGPNLSVEPVYAGKVAALVAGLDQQRQTLRGEISRQTSRPAVAQLARALSQSFTSAAGTLARLEAPLPAGRAHAQLYGALKRTAAAYVALANGASSNSLASYETARASVEAGEREVSAALEDYSLLGYGRA